MICHGIRRNTLRYGALPFAPRHTDQPQLARWVKRAATHIWSPPFLQDTVRTMTGTGLLPYIRPLDEERAPRASM